MLQLTTLELRSRRIPYAILLGFTFVTCLFVSFELVIMLSFLVLMRMNQLLNQRDRMTGQLRFYFLLPLSRKDVVYGKMAALAVVMIGLVTVAITAQSLSALLPIDLYTEGYDTALLPLIGAGGMSLAIILIANMQRFYLILGAEQMIVRTRVAVLVAFAILIVVFRQSIVPAVSVDGLIALGRWFEVFLWLIGPTYVVVSTIVTANQAISTDVTGG
jgi:hypothetical protein